MISLTEKDFEKVFEFYDVCDYCKKDSDKYQLIKIEGQNVYRCPNCGHIDNKPE